MPEDDDEAARPQSLRDLLVVGPSGARAETAEQHR